MKTGFAKNAARIILLIVLALICTLEAPASEMNDEAVKDYLVAKSPFRGHWTSDHPWRGTREQRFWVKDGKVEGALTEWKYDGNVTGGIDWSGEALNLIIMDGKISFTTPSGVRFDLELKEGKLVGTAFRTRYSKVTLLPSN